MQAKLDADNRSVLLHNFGSSSGNAMKSPLTVVRRVVPIALATAFFATSAHAAGVMTEQQARMAAAKLLRGNPYGDTLNQIMKNIESAQLVTSGTVVCGVKVTKPLWQFHILVPEARNPSGDHEINGFLAIDARTGKIACAGLPFLD
jgi:hypothetical protein